MNHCRENPNPKTLAIIPARKGSKRLPNKNMQLLGGKPLFVWMLEAAQKAKEIDRLVVSSDGEEILAMARSYDQRFALNRPAELAEDSSPTIDCVLHALQTLEQQKEGPFDIVVVLQPTSPLTLPLDIDHTIQHLKKTKADTVVSVVELDHWVHPAKLKMMKEDRLLPYLEAENGRMSYQELPRIFVRNGAVYASWRDVIEQKTVIGKDCRGLIMPRERSVDINELLDIQFAEFLISSSK